MRNASVALVTVLVSLIATGAAAGAGWVGQTVPAVQVGNGALNAVACPTASSCLAAGYYVDASGVQRVETQSWNGTKWTVSAAPQPSTATRSHLQGISCGSATTCVAVGAFGNAAADEQPLAESWNGTSWAVAAVPMPAGDTLGYLSGVSCTTSTFCVAVGSASAGAGNSVALAARWNGHSWTLLSTPSPSGVSESTLNGISCIGSRCEAVGDSSSQSGGLPTQFLVERWSGSAWSIQALTKPSGAASADLEGVSCTTLSACSAVGGWGSGTYTDHTYAARFNGTTWTAQTMPGDPTSSPSATLGSVSCAGATACTAVQSPGINQSTDRTPLVEHWNGTSWTVQTTYNPPGRIGWLYGVSCSANGCMSVGGAAKGGVNGSGQSIALAEQQAAGASTWKFVATLNLTGAADEQLQDVSCPATNFCATAGFSNSAAGPGLVAAEFNGSSWSRMAFSSPPPLTYGGNLAGISCTASNACSAVGYLGTSTGNTALAERWNGTSWSQQTMAQPAGAAQQLMWSVACWSSTACIAVGEYEKTDYSWTAIAERWTGSAWESMSLPLPTGTAASGLNGITCSSTGTCWAVGFTSSNPDSQSGGQALLERFTAGSWSIHSVPEPSGATYAELSAVWCRPTGATLCDVVGGYSTSGQSYPLQGLIERLSGSAFSQETTPYDGYTSYSGVSCGSTSACQVIGSYYAAGWDGTTWTAESTPPSAYLNGLACQSAGQCELTGATRSYGVVVQDIFGGLASTPEDVHPLAATLSTSGSSVDSAPPAVTSKALRARAGTSPWRVPPRG